MVCVRAGGVMWKRGGGGGGRRGWVGRGASQPGVLLYNWPGARITADGGYNIVRAN